jgi:predicted transcriptional regulator
MEDPSAGLVHLTAAIVGAFVENNSISQVDLPSLIATVHKALRSAGEPELVTLEGTVKRTSAQIRRSITSEVLISFEDGRGYKMLKRHLSTRGMTLAQYKAKWGLPRDYPTTAPNYSAARSAMAKALGLGQLRKQRAHAAAIAKANANPKTAAARTAPVRRGRPKKAANRAN